MMTSSFSLMLSGIVPEMGNHLWQSTVFAGVVGLLVLSLRRYQARVRYWLWLTASVKFLVPFSLLVSAGSRLRWSHHVVASKAGVYAALDGVSQPFSEIVPVPLGASVQLMRSHSWIGVLPIWLAGIWLCGFVAVLVFWSVQWRRIYAVMREAQPLREGREVEALHRMQHAAGVSRQIDVLVSRESMEPGIFGIVRPVLLWPEGISQRLDDAQLEAVLTHEVCHVQRRDNLTSLLHMLVEAVFWFHPLVWWMEGRLVEERERACDEEVLRLGKQPVSYAESILKVCEFCVESPLVCMSGVTGADLKKRIARIMSKRLGEILSYQKKLVLAASGVAVIAVPLTFGVVHGIPLYGQILHAIGPLPSFEVATIRPLPNGPPPDAGVSPPMVKRFFFTPKMLIGFAYNLSAFSENRIIKGQSWMDDTYEIQGKIDVFEYAAMQKMSPDERQEQIQLMTQSLLADRFKLKVHFETREAIRYALETAKSGPKLTPAKNDMPIRFGVVRYGQELELTSNGYTLDELAALLGRQPEVGGRVVVNKTGIAGTYFVTMRWTGEQQTTGVEAPSSSNGNGPSYFTAIQEQLGLRLVPEKGSVDYIVIDHIEKPSEN